MYANGQGATRATQKQLSGFDWRLRWALQARNTISVSRTSLGNGVTQDYAEAVKWYRLAAAQGYGQAQFSLGRMYANGQGVTKNLNEAQRL